MKITFLTFVLFALFASAESQSAKTATAQKEMDPLLAEKWFVGTWLCKGTLHASPTEPAVEFTDRFSFHMTLGDSWLMYQIDQLKGPVKGNQTLIGSITWDANAKLHVRRDMNIGGSRVDATSPGWYGDKLVFMGFMIVGDQKLPIKQTFTKKGDAAYDSALEVTGAEGKPTQWEEESCKKVKGARAMAP